MKTCLVIHKDNEMRRSAFGYLKRRKFQIREACSGEQALTMCREAMPDVILYDEAAGQVDKGLEFLRRLRRNRRDGPQPVVIYLCDEDDVQTLGAAILEGASECLIKPFDSDLLDFKLRQAGLGDGEGREARRAAMAQELP